MTFRVTTRGDAPISLRRVEQTRFPILTSASGMAMLAALPAESLALPLARARGEILFGSDPVDEVAIRASLIRARNDGFAVRDYFLPAEGSRLLAVATLAGGRPVGALAMAYLKDAVPHDHVALRIVPLLRGIAAEIGDIIRHYGGETRHAPGSCPNTSPEEIEK